MPADKLAWFLLDDTRGNNHASVGVGTVLACVASRHASCLPASIAPRWCSTDVVQMHDKMVHLHQDSATACWSCLAPSWCDRMVVCASRTNLVRRGEPRRRRGDGDEEPPTRTKTFHSTPSYTQSNSFIKELNLQVYELRPLPTDF